MASVFHVALPEVGHCSPCVDSLMPEPNLGAELQIRLEDFAAFALGVQLDLCNLFKDYVCSANLIPGWGVIFACPAVAATFLASASLRCRIFSFFLYRVALCPVCLCFERLFCFVYCDALFPSLVRPPIVVSSSRFIFLSVALSACPHCWQSRRGGFCWSFL